MADEATRPPPGPPRAGAWRGEDPPPAVYKPSPRAGEPIARVALRAPPVSEADTDPEVRLRAALQTSEASHKAEIEQWKNAFEQQLRDKLKSLVAEEVRSIPPPPLPAAAPPPHSTRFIDLSWVGNLPAILVALGTLVTVVAQSCAARREVPPEVTRRLDEISVAVKASDDKLAALDKLGKEKREEAYAYQLSTRSWIADVLERAASVKVDDPPGTPARDQLTFYPSPKVDPHKITGGGAHLVQPRDPFPAPPLP